MEYDKGTKRTFVRATQWLLWRNMMKDELFSNYVKSRWGECRVVGDNADGFESSNWNSTNFRYYDVKYFPGEEPELLKMDDKKKFYFYRIKNASTQTETDKEELNRSLGQIITTIAKRGRPRKNQVDADANNDIDFE